MDDFASHTPPLNEGGDWGKEMKKIAARCRGKSEDEILNEVYLRAREGKQNGTLTNGQIDYFCEKFSPLLSEEQKEKLRRIARELKAL